VQHRLERNHLLIDKGLHLVAQGYEVRIAIGRSHRGILTPSGADGKVEVSIPGQTQEVGHTVS